jgi:hypothetical protein
LKSCAKFPVRESGYGRIVPLLGAATCRQIGSQSHPAADAASTQGDGAAEEIKALTGGGEEGDLDVPVGDPWEYVLPTTTIILREDGKLPEWHRIDASGHESKDDPSNAPPDPWTWRDGAPTI